MHREERSVVLKRKDETAVSRTAERTCLSRASSALESQDQNSDDDEITPLPVTNFLNLLQLSMIVRPLGVRAVYGGEYGNIFLRVGRSEGVFGRPPWGIRPDIDFFRWIEISRGRYNILTR